MPNLTEPPCVFNEERAKLKKPRIKWRPSDNLKSFLAGVLCCTFSSLAHLEYRLYIWLSPLQVTAFSSLASAIFILPTWIKETGPNEANTENRDKRKIYFFQCVQSLLAIACVILSDQTYRRLPASIVPVLTAISPGICMVLSRMFLKERLTIAKLIALGMAIIAVILTGFLNMSVLDIYKYDKPWLGIAFGLALALASSLNYISMKVTSSNLNATEVNLANSVSAAIISVILLFTTDKFVVPGCGISSWLILGSALILILSKYSFYYACKYGEMAKLSVLLTSLSLMVSLLWDVILFGMVPQILQYLAFILVLFGTLLNGFSEIPRLAFINKEF